MITSAVNEGNLSSDCAAPSFASMNLIYPPTVIPRPDGSVIVRPGKLVIGEWLSTAQFGRLVGKSRRTIQFWCDCGKLNARQVGGEKHQWRIPVSEVERLRAVA
jgi:hypothetical protein